MSSNTLCYDSYCNLAIPLQSQGKEHPKVIKFALKVP